MHHSLLVVLLLLLAVVLLHSASRRLGLSFPILLVLVGLGISFIPGLPHLALDPDVVFLIFLPPLLYEAAWFTSWREFKRLRGAIGLQAVGLVFFSSAVVGWLTCAVVPGGTWALGFLLGGIIAPPDAVAATSVLHGLRIPRTSVAILEGESLVNDATSLIVVRFALVAVASGTLVLQQAAGQFVFVSVVGVLVGLGLAHALFVLHRFLHGTPAVDTALTLLSPYLMYVAAEQAHASGVLAVVAGGLYLSSRSHRFLGASASVYAIGTWATTVFVLNGIVFILIGLQLPEVTRDLGATSLGHAVGLGLLVSVVAIVVRIVWTFPSAFLPSFLPWRPKPRTLPDWRLVALVSWAGMRGVVSLASALAIPRQLPDGTVFPLRSLLIFITFVVILVTLVAQGLSLPWLVKKLRFTLPEDEAERRRALEERLRAHAAAHLSARGLAAPRDALEGAEPADEKLRRELVALQRAELLRLRNGGDVEHELARQKELELDLEAARLDSRLGAGHG